MSKRKLRRAFNHGRDNADAQIKKPDAQSDQNEGHAGAEGVLSSAKTEVPDPHSSVKNDDRSNKNGTTDHPESETVIAKWTIILGKSTIALVVATVVSAFILFRTDDKIGKQVAAMLSQLKLMENDQRPWLRVGVGEGEGLSVVDDSIGITLVLKYINAGKGPAVRVQSAAEMIPHDADVIRGKQDEMCRLADRSVTSDFLPTVFPDAPWFGLNDRDAF